MRIDITNVEIFADGSAAVRGECQELNRTWLVAYQTGMEWVCAQGFLHLLSVAGSTMTREELEDLENRITASVAERLVQPSSPEPSPAP